MTENGSEFFFGIWTVSDIVWRQNKIAVNSAMDTIAKFRSQ